MPDWLNLHELQLPSDVVRRAVFNAMMETFHVFTLVLVRVSGMMTIGPVFGQSVVPANVRVLLVLTVALVVTPALQDHWQLGFRKLDVDGNGLLEREEVPDHLLDRYDESVTRTGRLPGSPLRPSEFVLERRLPRTLLDYLLSVAGEFAVGLVLGLGVFIVLSSLSLAGQVIDQQSGLALGEISNPGLDTDGSITAQFLYLQGMTTFLLLTPVNGHVLVATTLIETFQTLPAGDAFVHEGVLEYVSNLVHLSLLLAVQVTAPVVAMMTLVSLTMGFLGYTVPQINVLVVGFPIRAVVSLVVLLLVFTGAARRVVDEVPVVLKALGGLLSGTG